MEYADREAMIWAMGTKMFYIRADGNEKIGMGHVMRCLTIAGALKRLGAEVLFLTADERPVRSIEERGFAVKVLSTRFDDMEAELPGLSEILAEGTEEKAAGKPKILLDSYFVTHRYLEMLKGMAKVILMDDEKRAVYPCDVLVNYNIFGRALGYERDYPAGAKLFLGCAYAPLREEFLDCAYAVRGEVSHILFTTGGGDNCHMALALARRLLKGQIPAEKDKDDRPMAETAATQEIVAKNGGKPVWHIVCGPCHPDTEELERLAAGSACVQIHKNVTHMSELMKRCDIAVSAAGSTFYELCSVGVPTVGFYFAENQRRNMETFAEFTPVKNAGDFSKEPEQALDLIEKEVETLCREKRVREEMSRIMRTVVDGKGAERLAEGFLAVL